MNEIDKITSIELDRSKPFNHVIKIKQDNYIAETIPVSETQGNQVLQQITEAWLKAINPSVCDWKTSMNI